MRHAPRRQEKEKLAAHSHSHYQHTPPPKKKAPWWWSMDGCLTSGSSDPPKSALGHSAGRDPSSTMMTDWRAAGEECDERNARTNGRWWPLRLRSAGRPRELMPIDMMTKRAVGEGSSLVLMTSSSFSWESAARPRARKATTLTEPS
jgi:hypothetical protein